MKLQYLGTGGGEGLPGIFCRCPVCLEAERRGGRNIRMRPGAVLDDDILLDYSPDLYSARLRFGVDLAGARDVIVTHADVDHFIPGHLEFYPYGPSVIRKGEGVTFYGCENVGRVFVAFMETPAGKRAEGYADFRLIRAGESLKIRDYTVTALPANHGREGFCNLYLIEKGDRALFYAHDTGVLHEQVWELLRGKRLGMVSMDASYGPVPSPIRGHMSFEDNIAARDRMLREGIIDEHTVFALAHFLHAGGMLHEEMVRLMEPKGFRIAYDGMTVEF